MGHYRSEMGYEDEDRKEAEWKAEKRRKCAERLREEMKTRDVADLLAEMVENPTMFSIRYR